jgi:penicillin-binding protein
LNSENIPVPVIDAVTSTEDKDFYKHFGVNWLAVTTRPICSFGKHGGSSITQQLIKNNIVSGAKNEYWQLTDSDSFRFLKTFERKTAELSMALAVEQVLSKNEILAAYLSMNYMGTSNGVNLQGFGAASQEYFSTNIYDVSDVSNPSDIAKAATLAGMIQGPENYLKFVKNGEKCAEKERGCLNLFDRRNKILDFMRENYPDKYSQKVIEAAKSQTLGFGFASQNRQERPLEADSRIFAKYAMLKENLPNELQKLRGEEGEMFVFTSLDERLQRDAVITVRNSMQKLQARVDAVTRKQKADNPQAFESLVKKCLEKNPKNPQVCDNLFKISASLIAIDARTGEILAMTGDVDAASKRSPGSVVKPFFYLKAIENGSLFGQPFTAATYIDKNRDAGLLSEYCAEDENLGGSGLAHEHLSKSWNIGSCFAAQSAGIPTDFVGKITNSTPERKLIAALGGTNGSETSLLSLVRAYTVFANNGKLVNPTAYKNAFQTENEKFNQIDFTGNRSAERLNPGATFITTQMMKSVVEGGTAANFRKTAKLPADADFAGKTGSGMIADLFFVGFSPRIVVGVWVGMPENLPHLRSADGFTGGKISAPIAAEFLQSVAKYRSELLEGKFVQPETVVKRNVEANNGCLVLSGGREEYFIEGREPQLCK